MSDSDPRVQAIRCTQCHRLRPYPNTEGTMWCLCGGRSFVPSFPMPGEEEWAIKIYERELRERGEWIARLPVLVSP